jgi:hypothetical protein
MFCYLQKTLVFFTHKTFVLAGGVITLIGLVTKFLQEAKKAQRNIE